MFNFVRRCSRLLLGTFAVLVLVPERSECRRAPSRLPASISGDVTDLTGGVSAGASVTLQSDQTGATRTATTSEDGRFSFAAVQPGAYTISIEQRGFQRLDKKPWS